MSPKLLSQHKTGKRPISLSETFTLSGPSMSKIETRQPALRPSAVRCQLSFRRPLLLLPLEFPERGSAPLSVLLFPPLLHFYCPLSSRWILFFFSMSLAFLHVSCWPLRLLLASVFLPCLRVSCLPRCLLLACQPTLLLSTHSFVSSPFRLIFMDWQRSVT